MSSYEPTMELAGRRALQASDYDKAAILQMIRRYLRGGYDAWAEGSDMVREWEARNTERWNGSKQ